MKEIFNVCHGEQTGNGEQKVWRQIGILIIAGGGKISIKLNSIPVNFDGWLQAFSSEKKQQKPAGLVADKKIRYESPKKK